MVDCVYLNIEDWNVLVLDNSNIVCLGVWCENTNNLVVSISRLEEVNIQVAQIIHKVNYEKNCQMLHIIHFL